MREVRRKAQLAALRSLVVLLARSELDAIRRPAGGLSSNLMSSGACLKDSWQSGCGPGDGPSPPKFCAPA